MQEDDAVKRIALLLLVAACGGKYQAPPPVASIALPDGSQLNPYDSTKPGKARPQGMAAAAGRVYVTLSNQRDTDTFPVNAGPGFLAAFNPSSDKVTLIDLGGTDGHQCQNPGFVRASADGYLYSPCSGNFSGTDGARAIVEVAPVAVDCAKSKFSYVADVMTIRGDVYALCASDTSGELYRLDPDGGAIKSHTTVGPNPTELAGLDDGRIVVVNAGDNTLTVVTASGVTLSASKVLTFSSQTAALQDVRAFGRTVFTVASGSNTAQRIDLDYFYGVPKVVAEANFGPGA